MGSPVQKTQRENCASPAEDHQRGWGAGAHDAGIEGERHCSDFKREGQWETLLLSTDASSKYKDGPKLFLEVQNGNTRSNAPSWNSENSG